MKFFDDDNNPSWYKFSSYLGKQALAIKSPISGTFELTPRCNLSCKMCYVRLSPEEMLHIGVERTTSEWIELGKQAAKAGTLFLLLTGGEPFLRKDFFEIYEALSNMGFLITIYTNGTLIDEKAVNLLKRNPPDSIKITMYGASNETYEKVCNVKYGYDKAVNAINMLMEAKLPLMLGSTFIKDNIEDTAKLRDFASSLDLTYNSTVNVVGEVRGAQGIARDVRISDMQFRELFAKEQNNSRVPGLFSTGGPLEKCKKANCGYWITWDGKMTMCSFLDEPYTLPFKAGFDSAWSELLLKISEIAEPVKCLNCKYKAFCVSCPGICCAETGSYCEVSDRMCNIAESLYNLYSSEINV